MRRLAAEFLQQHDYEVVEACDCDTALDMLEELRVDIVITDVIMAQGLEGMAFITALRERAPSLPIIAMSAGFTRERADVAERALAVGASAVLPKPFEPDELIGHVDRLLAG
jgi:DNA-binding response OmpR family regulator